MVCIGNQIHRGCSSTGRATAFQAEDDGSFPFTRSRNNAEVAQLVERRPEEPGVGDSISSLRTNFQPFITEIEMIAIGNVPVTYVPEFVKDADRAYTELWNELAWERRGNTPRREYYANDNGAPYTYGIGAGARTYEPGAWHARMKTIRSAIEHITCTSLDVCFLNGYENSRDHLGWHADDSPEMDDGRPIAIVSLGAAREIWFCPRGNRSDVTKLVLESGSLCVMAPGMQDTHLHRIPKAGFECGPRISLTFRGYAG